MHGEGKARNIKNHKGIGGIKMASNLQVVILTILFIGTMGMAIYTVSDMLGEIRKEEKHE